ncbi:MAG: shikimate dehydrogenase [Bacteroidales bacterium]|nr:shikimate dehydrogenase [Bacteroidales bacterium]
MHTFGLIGFPLGHSFSVPYFTKKFSDQRIDAEYKNYPLEDISEFEALVQTEPGLMGLNVTVPYKQKIIPFMDALSKTARTIKAVNTVLFCRRDNRLTLIGHNTDVRGFRQSLKEHLLEHHTSALVLGTGGSSNAVTHVLDELDIDFQLVSRSRGEGKISYEDVDKGMVSDTPLLINTTPLGMHPDVGSYPEIPFEAITSGHLLFDLVYNPERTQFLSKGIEMGAVVVNGYDMLVYQAEASWEIWNRKN